MATASSTPTAAQLAEAAREHRQAILDCGLPLGEASEPAGPGAETKVRILDTAVTLFADRGYEASTMRDLASAVGIKAPAIYNHYASKDDVLGAAMEHILGRFFWDLVMPLEDRPVEEWLRLLVEQHVRFQLEHPRLSQANDTLLDTPAVERALPKAVRERIRGAAREYVELVRALVCSSSSASADEALVAAFSIIAMCDRVAAWYEPSGRMTVEEVGAITWRLASGMVDRL